MTLPALIILAGPTAVGKSEIALRLAGRLNGEIVSVDSMQVYRGLDIGTAKPSTADRNRVPHHLIDVVSLDETFDAARFSEMAGKSAAEVRGRGRVPILCGGTGLYFKAFLEGLGDAPPGSPELRRELEATPLPVLLQELAERDPAAFESIDRSNPRRVIRAVEVTRLTGRPFSGQRAPWQKLIPASAIEMAIAVERSTGTTSTGTPRIGGEEDGNYSESPAGWRFGFTRPIPLLRKRIDARVEEMFRRGWVAETRRLLEQGLGRNPQASQALGYRQIIEHLRGERSLEETVALVKTRTHQFAKRQMTWFRRQMNLRWIELQESESAAGVAERIAAAAADPAFPPRQM